MDRLFVDVVIPLIATSLRRSLIRVRTVAGVKAAPARRRKGGRPAELSPKEIRSCSRYRIASTMRGKYRKPRKITWNFSKRKKIL